MAWYPKYRIGNADLPRVRPLQNRGDAYGCLPMVLRVRTVPHGAQAQARRLLRLLFLRHGSVPTDPGAVAREVVAAADPDPEILTIQKWKIQDDFHRARKNVGTLRMKIPTKPFVRTAGQS